MPVPPIRPMAEPRERRLVAITRPEEDSRRLARELEGQGHPCLIAPLLDIRVETGRAPVTAGVQAILITSRHAAPALRRCAPGLGVYAVGDATARAARDHYAGPVTSAAGDGAALARLVRQSLKPGRGALLHLAGRAARPEPEATLRAAGFEVRRQVVYRAEPATELPEELRTALEARTLGAILFFSPRTAATLRKLIGGAGLEGRLGTVDALCLSAAVAGALGDLHFRSVRVAPTPDRAALLGLLDGVP